MSVSRKSVPGDTEHRPAGQPIIREPGNRTIFRVTTTRSSGMMRRLTSGCTAVARRRAGPDGNTVSTIVRPDGSRIEVEVDSYGRPLRRVRIFPRREAVRSVRKSGSRRASASSRSAPSSSICPPRTTNPARRIHRRCREASRTNLWGALSAGPVEPLPRGYSLDEVLASIS